MPSPFPGMDPFLEGPDAFPDFHNSLAVYLRNALQTQLLPPYFASLNERTWIELSERAIEPDVALARVGRSLPHGSVALAEADLPPRAIVVPLAEEEHREPYLELFTGRGRNRRLVTCIEILSPSNKTRGSQGYRLYRQKQRELLLSDVNLVEIDLLRAGEHTTAVPRSAAERLTGPFDYHVCVRYSDRPEAPVVYPVKLRDSLPEIAVPLLPGNGTVTVDLQVVFAHLYDDGPYHIAVDYSGPVPPPPLGPSDAAWTLEQIARSRTLLHEERPKPES